MLAIVKEVGVDLVVGDGLGLMGELFCSILSLCRVCEAMAGRGKDGICTCRVSGLCDCGESCGVGKDHGKDSGRPTPGMPGRCMHEGYTDIILNASTLAQKLNS